MVSAQTINGNASKIRLKASFFFIAHSIYNDITLNEIENITCPTPGGAFYVWPNVTEACEIIGVKNSEEFRKKLLYEAGVAVLADIHFGHQVAGEGQHIRLSYATSSDNIKEGITRISEYLNNNRK